MKNENHFFALRGKSDRRRIRDSKRQQEKALIELCKKEQTLNKLYSNLGYEPLEPPYQKGFKRFFVLRNDIAKSKKADFYLELLKYINTTQHSLRKDFKKKKRKGGKRIYTESEQYLKRFYDHEFCKIPEKFRPHFMKVERYFIQRKCVRVMYIYAEPWRYVLQVQPHMVTHCKRLDSALESETDQLENYIERNYLRPEMNKVRGKKHKWKDSDLPEKEKQLPVFKLMQQINEQH